MRLAIVLSFLIFIQNPHMIIDLTIGTLLLIVVAYGCFIVLVPIVCIRDYINSRNPLKVANLPTTR